MEKYQYIHINNSYIRKRIYIYGKINEKLHLHVRISVEIRGKKTLKE